MKIWKLVAVPIALLSTQALAHDWVKVATDTTGISTSIARDSIQKGDYNLVYFIDYDESLDGPNGQDVAVDCQQRVFYIVDVTDHPDWHNRGQAVEAGTVGEAELQYVCANAP